MLEVPAAQISHVPPTPADPASQFSHAVLSSLGCIPLWHCWHPEPSAEKLPSGHARQIPVTSSREVPASHGSHADLSSLGRSPAEQAKHAIPSTENVPGSVQRMQPTAASSGAVPGAQGKQTRLSDGLCVPSEHLKQLVRSSDAIAPAGQLKHCPSAEASRASHGSHDVCIAFGPKPAPQATQSTPSPRSLVAPGRVIHSRFRIQHSTNRPTNKLRKCQALTGTAERGMVAE